jgi:hypothetical protein
MMLLRILSIGAILAAGAAASCAEPPRPDEVKRLIDQLDADTRAERQAAEKALLKLGPELLPLLPPPDLLQSPAVRETVVRLRVELERRKAIASVRASRVTLSATKSPLRDVLAEIAKQTDNRLEVKNVPQKLLERRVNVSFSRTPYWRAVDQLCELAGLRLVSRPAAKGPALESAPKHEPGPRTLSGAFRVAVVKATTRPIFGDPAHKMLRVGLQVACEPRLRPLFLKVAGDGIEATTSGGEMIPPRNPDAQLELPLGGGGHLVEFQIDYKVPAARRPAKIDLAGKFHMETAAGVERIAFPVASKASGVARRRGGVTVTVTDVTAEKSDNGKYDYVVGARVGYDTGGPAFESHRTWILHNRVHLESDTGEKYELNGRFETRLQADGAVALSYRFPNIASPPDKTKFVYMAPTLIVDVPIDVDLKNVPLSQPESEKP